MHVKDDYTVYLRQGVRKEEEDRRAERQKIDRRAKRQKRDSSGEVSRQTGGERSADRWAE